MFWHLPFLMFLNLLCLILIGEGEVLSHLLLQIFFLFLSLFHHLWFSHYLHMRPFVVAIQFLNILGFFFLIFSVFEDFLGISSTSEIISSAISSLLISPSKTSLIAIAMFLHLDSRLVLSLDSQLFAYLACLFSHVLCFIH